MKRKVNVPDTSKEAFDSLPQTEIGQMYNKILMALEVIQEGTFEMIAAQIGVEPSKVWKRLSEMMQAGMIYRPGTKYPLKSGRQGYTWRRIINSSPTPPPSIIENKKIEGKSVGEYAKQILQQAKMFP